MLISFIFKIYIIFKFISARTLIRAFKILVSYSTTVAVYCKMEKLELVHLKFIVLGGNLLKFWHTQTMEYFAHFKHSNKLLSSCCMS